MNFTGFFEDAMRFSYATHAILRFLKENKIACNRKCQSIFVQNGYIMSQRFKISDKLSFVKIQETILLVQGEVFKAKMDGTKLALHERVIIRRHQLENKPVLVN